MTEVYLQNKMIYLSLVESIKISDDRKRADILYNNGRIVSLEAERPTLKPVLTFSKEESKLIHKDVLYSKLSVRSRADIEEQYITVRTVNGDVEFYNKKEFDSIELEQFEKEVIKPLMDAWDIRTKELIFLGNGKVVDSEGFVGDL